MTIDRRHDPPASGRNGTRVANGLSLFRILTVAPLVALVLQDRFAAAAALYAVALVTDVADGVLARRTGSVTRRGAVLDPAADILLTAGLYGALGLAGLIPAWVVGILYLRYFTLITGLVTILTSFGAIEIHATRIGKIVGVLQGTAGIMILVLAGFGLQLSVVIELMLSVILGIIFGSVTLSQIVVGIKFSGMTPNAGSPGQAHGFRAHRRAADDQSLAGEW